MWLSKMTFSEFICYCKKGGEITASSLLDDAMKGSVDFQRQRNPNPVAGDLLAALISLYKSHESAT